MIRSCGHCNTMGLLAEALGMVIPGLAGTRAPDSRLLAGAHATGRLAVELIASCRRPSQVMTRASFHIAIDALDDIDRIGVEVLLLVNLQPAAPT